MTELRINFKDVEKRMHLRGRVWSIEELNSRKVMHNSRV